MIKTIDFNGLASGTIVNGQYADDGVTISAVGGSGDAMIFDTNNPTGGDTDLATSNLDGVLIISEDGDTTDADDNAGGGCLVFDFDNEVLVKHLTFLDIEEGARMFFYDADGNLLEEQYVDPTGDNGQRDVQLNVDGVARLEVVLNGSGAIDNLIYDDPLATEPSGDGDGIVSGTAGDDVIDLGYTGDPEGDRIDAGDAVLPGEAADDDIVDAGAGNDTITSLEGDDEVYAGSGHDVVEGGAGNDVIHGDSNLAGGSNDTTTVRESFEWDLAGVSDTGRLNGFTQDTGNTNVTYSILSETSEIHTEFSTDAQNVAAIEDDGAPVNGNSSLDSETRGLGQQATYQLGFDNPVTNVDFRINDIDGDGVVRVLAYDADGNQIPVTLSAGSRVTLLDTDGVAGADTGDSNGGYLEDTAGEYSMLVSIAGPVSRIVIEHSQDGGNNSGINVTDVYFDAVVDGDPAADGNDDLSGGEGDDSIYGEGGDDTLTGGEGADLLSGGDDADTFLGGTAGDAVDGGAGGVDNDTLDLSGAGPVRILTQTDDADGNSTSGTIGFLDEAGNVVDTMTFTEIENLILPENSAPIANDDSASVDENSSVVVPVTANDTDPDGDALTVISATSDDGEVVINDDGSISFYPNPGFFGETTISYTVSDGNGGTDSAIVTVTVNELEGDGYVDGTSGDDLIDLAYTGDPQGDRIDDEDALLPGEAPNDDIVRAGDGNDTVYAGVGDDEVLAGDGDDLVYGEDGDDILAGGDGNDTVLGGEGDDVIDTGSGEVRPDIGYPGFFEPDSDPENDRDSVDGGAGNDTIRTGDDRDTITGGAGDDVIDAGIDDDIVSGNDGDDRIVGGEGNDSILGGDGNDTIYAGNDPDRIPDGLDIEDDGSNPLGPDLRPDNGRDTVDGGDGDDVIYGADDDDLLIGGSGNDYLDGQIDDDVLDGGMGLDTLVGGQGDDSLSGGLGDDELDGGIGNDTLRGNRDDDTLRGGDGDDLLDGGGQNDLLIGGEGNDTMFGGADRDTFISVNAGDVVNGNEAGDDFDTLDLTGSAPVGGRLEVEYDPSNAENGTVYYYDADNNPAGQLDFTNIENVIPCFTPGTLIATPKGERRVETLEVGDRVITRDNGIQEIRWVGSRKLTGRELAQAEHLRPVLIRRGALGNDLPERDMMVSPNHRVLVANDKTALYFEEREVLVAAKHLTGLEGVDVVEVSETTYIHIMFDQHEVILSDGTWTESFQPGDMSLAGIGNAQRQEILELFPELATREGIAGYTSARKSLKRHEAKLVLK